METCYKVFHKKVLKNIKLNSNGFGIEPEITAKLIKAGFKIEEVSIRYSPRKRKEKKIKLKDGFKAIWILMKYKS